MRLGEGGRLQLVAALSEYSSRPLRWRPTSRSQSRRARSAEGGRSCLASSCKRQPAWPSSPRRSAWLRSSVPSASESAAGMRLRPGKAHCWISDGSAAVPARLRGVRGTDSGCCRCACFSLCCARRAALRSIKCVPVGSFRAFGSYYLEEGTDESTARTEGAEAQFLEMKELPCLVARQLGIPGIGEARKAGMAWHWQYEFPPTRSS